MGQWRHPEGTGHLLGVGLSALLASNGTVVRRAVSRLTISRRLVLSWVGAKIGCVW